MKTARSHVILHGNFFGPVSATDLVKRLGKSHSLNSKTNFLVGGSGFLVSDIISRGLLGHLGPLPPGLKPLDGSISLKFLLETRLQSESFDTLDDLLGFRVEKL